VTRSDDSASSAPSLVETDSTDDAVSFSSVHSTSEPLFRSDVGLPSTPAQTLYDFKTTEDSAFTPPVELPVESMDLHLDPDIDILDLSPPVDLLHTLRASCRVEKLSVNKFYQRMRGSDNALTENSRVGYKYRAHFDGGASASTTNQLHLLWNCHPITTQVRLRVADGNCYTPTHAGFLSVPTGADSSEAYEFVPCFYTKGVTATIISPHHTCNIWGRFRGVSTYVKADGSTGSVHLHHDGCKSRNVDFPCSIHNGLLYSRSLRIPSDAQRENPLPRPAVIDPGSTAVQGPTPVVDPANQSPTSPTLGMQGQPCYCLITDRHTGMLWGHTFHSTAPPIDSVNRWLLHFGLPVDSMGTNGAGTYDLQVYHLVGHLHQETQN